MKHSIFKPILGGIIAGAVFFLMPFFILKVVVFFMIAGLLFRLFAGRRMHHYRAHKFAFADRIRQMSDEDYLQFKEKFANSHGCHHHDYSSLTPSNFTTDETKK